MLYNFVADIFHTKQLCSCRLSSSGAILHQKRPLCVFEPLKDCTEMREGNFLPHFITVLLYTRWESEQRNSPSVTTLQY